MAFWRGWFGRKKAHTYLLEGRTGKRGKWVKILALESEIDLEAALTLLEQPEIYSKLRLKEMNGNIPIQEVWTQDNPEFDESMIPTTPSVNPTPTTGRIIISKDELDEYKGFLKARMDAGLDIMKSGYEGAVNIMKEALTQSTKITAEQYKAKRDEAKALLEVEKEGKEGEGGSKKGGGVLDTIIETVVAEIAGSFTRAQIQELKKRRVEVPER